MAYVPVIQRGGKVTPTTGYIPVAQRIRKSIFEMEPGIDLGLTFPIKTAETTPALLPEGTITPQNLAKAAGQGIARQWAATGARLASQIGTADTDIIDPKTYFGVSPLARKASVAIFGREEPFNATTEDIEFLEVFGVDPEIAKGTGGSLTLLLTTLDFTGASGGPKGVVGFMKAIKAAKTAEEAAKIARSVGFADDVIETYKDVWAATKTMKATKESVEAAIKLQETTRAGRYVPVAARPVSEVAKVAPRVIDEALEPLAQEVMKAEDLLKENVFSKNLLEDVKRVNSDNQWIKVSFDPHQVKYGGNLSEQSVRSLDKNLKEFRAGDKLMNPTFERIKKAGLEKKPILIETITGKGEISILDGSHRLAFAREKNLPIEAYIPKSELTKFNQAVRGVEPKVEIPKIEVPELKPKIPQTIDDFDKLAFEEQERVFDFLPPELQAKIMGSEVADVGLSPVRKLADDIVAGKIKVQIPTIIKTEALEELGSANYARIFRKDKIFPPLDALASDVGISSDDLIREISSALDRRGITNRTLLRTRSEIREAKLPQLRQRIKTAKTVDEKQRFLQDFQREITEELTKKRFSILQKIRAEEKAFERGEKIGVQEFKRQERLLTGIQKDIERAVEAPKGRERSRISFIKQLGEFGQTAIQDAKRQLDTIKPIREMNLEELQTLATEMKNRLKFKLERGFQPSVETAEKLRIQPKDSPKPIFDDSFYQKNLEVKAEKPPRLEPVKKFVESFVELADRLGGSISTRLKNINPILKARLRKYEFDVRMVVKNDRETSERLLEGFSKVRKSPEDFWTLDLALKNGDTDTAVRIFRKHGLEDEYGKVKKMLDDIWDRADEVGFDIGYQKDYWPRQIKDPKGFLEHLMGTEARSLIEEAFKRKEMDLGRFLTIEERASLANTMIRGYRGGQITLFKTGAMKERVLDFVTPELNKFYQDADITLVNYIERTNDAIEARKFFGKQKALEGAEKEALNNVKDSIGTFVADLMAKGEISALDEIELRSILEARFNPAKTGLAIGVYKNLAYIDTLGSVVNAVTQLGDLAFAMYKGGPVKGLVEGAKSVIGKVKITKEDIGFAQREISSELERSGLGGLLDRLFRITGFNKIDRLGAEGLINASVRKAQEEALENSPRLLKELDSVFPEKLFGEGIKEQVLRELTSGEITDNVKFYAMNVLLDFSPRALSEMPEQYLRSGNGRIFYVLKTWTLKLFDVYRNEVFQVMKENPKQGIKNALELGILLFAVNATTDEIKDFMKGRETNFKDLVVNNLAKLAGFSRYHITQISREGLAATLGAELVPPFPAIDNISKDVIGLFKDFDKASDISNIRTIRELPIGGELFYWWFGPGREFIEKEQTIETPSKKLKTPLGLPELPSLERRLPALPGLPKLP